jgi:hypothetical protein
MLQRTVSTSLDLAITPFACAHMDTASAPVDNRIFKVHWANDMASTLKKSLLWVGVIAGLNAAEICGARAACDDPRYVALRQSLVAQLNSIGARIEAGNCGLIPSWLSFARSGNARLARSLRSSMAPVQRALCRPTPSRWSPCKGFAIPAEACKRNRTISRWRQVCQNSEQNRLRGHLLKSPRLRLQQPAKQRDRTPRGFRARLR